MRTLGVLVAVAGCASSQPDGPEPEGCTYPVGARHEQRLANGDGQSDRTYFLYVPTSAPCDAPLPLLVDFHGTAATESPELAYATDELLALAEREHVIIARPRSRSAMFDGVAWHQWDVNPGDLARNQTFARNLVAELVARLPVDPGRVYASGFSSGANMASSFLADREAPFRGVAPIAGGTWALGTLPDLTTGPKLYVGTGYRDYLWTTTRALLAKARAAGIPADRLLISPTGGGHDLHGWQFAELLAFFDRDERPRTDEAVASPWVVEALPAPADVNALAVEGTTLVAAGAQGKLWRREASGWTLELSRDTAELTALCFGPPGRGFVGGSGVGIRRTPAGWAADAVVPDYGGFQTPSVTAASCNDDGRIAIVGYWSAAVSDDGGASWSRLSAPITGSTVDAWMLGVAASPEGAMVIAGYPDYLARVAPASTTAVANPPARAGWWNAVAAADGTFWAVGDDGALARSVDDGVTWSDRASGTAEDLYAVHFADAQHGAAVGRRGTVIVTIDGGATWTPRPIGRDSYLGAVRVDGTSIWVAGQDGLVARSPW